MKKITLFIAGSVLSICAFAQGSVTYTFDSVKTTSGIIDPSPLPTATGIVCSSFSAIGTPPNSLAAQLIPGRFRLVWLSDQVCQTW